MALDVCLFLGYTKKQSINYAEDFTKQKRNTSTINIINISKKKKQKVVDPTIKNDHDCKRKLKKKIADPI